MSHPLKLTAKQMELMLGCDVSYKGREGTIMSIRPDMERLGLPSLCIEMHDTKMVAVVRPSELAS